MTQSNPDDIDKFAQLRKQAEEHLTQEAQRITTLSLEETRRILYDLNVYKIELELQNEQLRETQAELEASRRMYKDLYEMSPVGLLNLDGDGRIFELNLTLSKMIGISRHKLIRRDLREFIDPSSQERYHFFFQQLRRAPQHPIQCEITLHTLQQEALIVRLEGVVLAQENAPVYRLAVSDVTPQKQLETQTQELTVERQRIAALSEFIQHFSHHIRTPLNTVMGSLCQLTRPPVADEQWQLIDDINDRVSELNEVLDQIQQMVVLDNLTRIQGHPEDLNDLVREVCQAFKPHALVKEVNLITHFQDGLSPVPLDSTQMTYALQNLLSNALRFTPKGGTVLITTFQKDKTLCLEISDTGTGIEADALPYIFKRFYKAKASGDPLSIWGSGLGLSIVKRVIELHQGSIDVSSIPGVSTVFTIRLPLPDES